MSYIRSNHVILGINQPDLIPKVFICSSLIELLHNTSMLHKSFQDCRILPVPVHPAAAKWQYTPMPFFKELSIIFEKDIATGNLAKNLEDVVEELNTEAAAESLREDIQRSAHSDESTTKKRKKGNVDSLLEAVYAASDIIANQFEASTKLLISAEEDMLGKKKQLNEELSKIPGLEVLQKLQVAKRFDKD